MAPKGGLNGRFQLIQLDEALSQKYCFLESYSLKNNKFSFIINVYYFFNFMYLSNYFYLLIPTNQTIRNMSLDFCFISFSTKKKKRKEKKWFYAYYTTTYNNQIVDWHFCTSLGWDPRIKPPQLLLRKTIHIINEGAEICHVHW